MPLAALIPTVVASLMKDKDSGSSNKVSPEMLLKLAATGGSGGVDAGFYGHMKVKKGTNKIIGRGD